MSIIVKHLCKFVVLLIILSISIPNTSRSQDEDDEWSYPHYESGVQSLMNGLHAEWRTRDGAKTFEIADKMFWALLLDPNEFYIEFTNDTSGYRHFKEGLDKFAFWNPNDSTTAHLIHLKQLAIWQLDFMTWDIKPDYLQFHKEMIEAVKRARVSYIDEPVE